MVPRQLKISKQAGAGIIRHICHYGRIQFGLLTIYGTKKHKEKITCKNLVQYRFCLMINYLILWHLSSSVGTRLNKFYCISTYICLALRIILWISIFNYVEIRLYFHLSEITCRQTHPVQTLPHKPILSAPPKNNHNKTFSFSTVKLFQLARNIGITTTDSAGHS